MPKDYFDYNPEEEKEVVSETDKEGGASSSGLLKDNIYIL
jgi:hypothetical protein